jgi:hypothetical protein
MVNISIAVYDNPRQKEETLSANNLKQKALRW